MTVGQRWRCRRDHVLYVVWRAGVPQRLLADVFDLAPSRVAGIIARVRRQLEAKSDSPGVSASAAIGSGSMGEVSRKIRVLEHRRLERQKIAGGNRR